MNAPQARTKQGLKWGTFLSGAVANLESRLDTFFEEEGNPAKPPPKQRNDGRSASPAPRTSGQISRSSSQSRSRSSSIKRDRVAQLAAPNISASPLRASSETRGADTTTTTPDSSTGKSVEATDLDAVTANNELNTKLEAAAEIQEAVDRREFTDVTPEPSGRPSLSLASDASNRPSLDTEDRPVALDVFEGLRTDAEAVNGDAAPAPTPTVEELQAKIAQMQADREGEALQRQEEVQSYLERVDALQAKLQYLAAEAASSAREKASDATGDSLQKKLAAKDEQIALLMEEGQKLSKAEVTHAGAAKKLRQKIAEDGNVMAELRRKAADSNRQTATLTDKVRRLEVGQRDAATRLARMSQLEKELQNLKAANDEKEATVQYLRSQLDSESRKADEAHAKANEAALEKQRKANQSLQDDLANAKIERQLNEERLRAEIKAAKEEAQREKESKKAASAQMQNEITILESRLESLRARTEEATSGNTNDGQAKLMRQIETLQTQYSLASDNWQGIESSLQARLTALEKERDDTARAESDARKKARESGNKSRRVQEQLDEVTRKASVLEQELSERQAHADRIEQRAQQFEKDIKEVKSNFELERQQWQTTLASRIEEEKAKWRQEASPFSGVDPTIPSVVESPGGSIHKPHGLDLRALGLSRQRLPSRQFSTELSIPSVMERPGMRRTSTKPYRGLDVRSPGQDSGRSTPFLNGAFPEAPSIHTQEPDENFDNDSSPHRSVNDMVSVSTANAGPSVQLVERMSAAVRRLESEKAATKDELSRLATQRDEARKEVVSLMGEIEDKRALDTKVVKLQQDLVGVEERYQTTLEMLGERSERVEELEADVADLKKIYRELVQTMR